MRDLLFGAQVRETERKQAALERFIKASVMALGEDMQRKMDSLKHELSLLADRLDDEGRHRKAAVATALERFTNVDQHIERLSNQTRADQHEIRQRLLQETRQLGQQMQDWRQDMLEQLRMASTELQHDKADRKSMAALLQQMAQQLAEEPDNHHDADREHT
ncbi:MAG: hypothetical protein R3E89_19195 [Thiolinea sp.]